MTALLDALLDLLEGWRAVFPQKRTFGRALRLALAQVLAPGCRTISRIIAACGRDQRDWSADYRVFSRSPWQQEQLFQVPITAGLEHFAQRDHIAVAGDFTHLVKTGRRIPNVRCMRDPMSPPFHANLVHGLRFVQYTLLLPLYENAENDADDGQDGTPPRSVPVCFREVPVPAKPGKKATDEERAAYKAKQRQRPASRMALEALVRLRADFDAMMLLAAQNAYGGTRTDAYVPLPKWRKGAKRPSCQDIVNELRREMEAEPQKLRDFASQTAVMAAATFRAAA
jgi:hypothetical protein